MEKEFQAALKKGYTCKDISNALKAGGIPLSVSLIKAQIGAGHCMMRKGKFQLDTEKG